MIGSKPRADPVGAGERQSALLANHVTLGLPPPTGSAVLVREQLEKQTQGELFIEKFLTRNWLTSQVQGQASASLQVKSPPRRSLSSALKALQLTEHPLPSS